jgi:hypothetical protein
MARNIGRGGGTSAGQPVLLIQFKIQISIYILLYCRSLDSYICYCDGSQQSILVLATL